MIWATTDTSVSPSLAIALPSLDQRIADGFARLARRRALLRQEEAAARAEGDQRLADELLLKQLVMEGAQ